MENLVADPEPLPALPVTNGQLAATQLAAAAQQSDSRSLLGGGVEKLTSDTAGKDSDREVDSSEKDQGKAEPESALLTVPVTQQTPPSDPLKLLLSLALPVPQSHDVHSGQNLSDAGRDDQKRSSTLALANGGSQSANASSTALASVSIQRQSKTKADGASDQEILSAFQAPSEDKNADQGKSELAFAVKLTAKETRDAVPNGNHGAVPPSSKQEASASQSIADQAKITAPSKEKGTAQEKSEHVADAADRAAQAAIHNAGAESSTKPAESAPVVAPANHASKVPDHTPATEQAPLSSTAGLEPPDPAPGPAEPARDISFRVTSDSNSAVDIKLTDRAGQIQVAVHSADPALTKSLQANVSDLAGKLERSGFHAETSLPNRTEPARESQQNPGFQDSSSRERRQQQQEFQQSRRRNRTSDATFSLSTATSIQEIK